MPLRIVFMGTPDFAVPTLAEIVGAGHHVVAAYSQPARAAGRGMAERKSPVQTFAEAAGIPVLTPANFKAEADKATFAAHAADAAVVVAYGLLLPVAILDAPRFGCFNLHPSALPRWRGAAPIQRAILAGDAETGVTIMQLDAGLDTGPMLLERKRAIGPHDTAGDLHDALAELGAGALIEALDALAAGNLQPRAQPAVGASYAPKIEKSEAILDWSASAIVLDRKTRAFNPWPMTETRFGDETLRIIRARVAEPGGVHGEPGTLLGIADDGLRVACGEGVLAVGELQRAGKRPVSARDFANAVRVAGLKFGP